MKHGLTKHDSFAIKGLAIILMLFHHLYCTADRFNGFEIDFTPFSQTFVVNVAFLFKVCVSLFAFITGYGLLKSIAGQNFNRKDIVKYKDSVWLLVYLYHLSYRNNDNKQIALYNLF